MKYYTYIKDISVYISVKNKLLYKLIKIHNLSLEGVFSNIRVSFWPRKQTLIAICMKYAGSPYTDKNRASTKTPLDGRV